MTVLAVALAVSGFAALCLAMEKHRLEVFGRDGRILPARSLRPAGWLLLTASFAVSVAGSGWAIGPVLWLGALTAAALPLVFWMLPYRPRALVPLALALPPAAAVWWLLEWLAGPG